MRLDNSRWDIVSETYTIFNCRNARKSGSHADGIELTEGRLTLNVS